MKDDFLNLKVRTNDEIWVNEFTIEKAQEFRDQVLEKAIKPDVPIVIRINSPGGMVDALAMMLETMDELPNPFITVCYGLAASCGAILLSHGDVRWVTQHSRVLVHEVSSATSGDVHDMHADAIETKRLNKHFMGLLARNCGIKGGYDGLRKLIKAHDGRDIYLDAESAVKFGIADAVGVPKVVTATLHEVFTAPTKSSRLQDIDKRKVLKK